jgi:hypothetical protein
MANDIGFSVKEGVNNGLAPFTQPSKRNIGLLMERVRGVENTPFLISSQAEDTLRFGGMNPNMYGPYVVRNMFRNAKGKAIQYYGIRIVGSGSAAATTGNVTVQGVTHNLTAGQQGSPDKGTWGNGLTAIFYSYNYKKSNEYVLEVYLDGVLVETISASTMAALQLKINNESMYVMASFSAEYTLPAWTALANSAVITTTSGSPVVTANANCFNTTDTPVGSLLRVTSTGDILGVIASIDSPTQVTLEKNATVVVTSVAGEAYKRFRNNFTFSGGVYNAPTEANFYYQTVPTKRGLALFDGVDVQIIGVTEYNTLTMTEELNNYCASQRNYEVLGVFCPPLNASQATLENYASTLQSSNKSALAGYNVWVRTSDGFGGFVTVPGLGCVLGAGFVRVPALQNDYVHIPPAGIDSSFVDVTEVYPKLLTQAQINYYTRSLTINSVVFTKGIGYYILTSRTYSTNPLYQSIHIYLLTSYYVRTLRNNMGFVIQKPNTPQLKRDIYSVLYAFFKTEYDNGALENSVDFSTACQIICDRSNNPPSQPRTELNCDINYIPTETTEAFRISLNRNDGVLLVNAV